MKILLASSEVYPYSKSGGLAVMVGGLGKRLARAGHEVGVGTTRDRGERAGALGKWLARAGHEVGVVTPLYRGIRERFSGIKKTGSVLDLPLGPQRAQAEVCPLLPTA